MLARLRRVSGCEWACAVLLALLLTQLAYLVGDTGYGRVNALQEALAAKQVEVDTYLHRNQLIAAQLRRIKNDPAQIEVLARYHFGMVKPGEIFIQTGR